MKAVFAILLVSMPFIGPLLRTTNSRAAVSRGIEQFRNGDPTAAAESFARAQALRPTAAGAFDSGTARIAAGDRVSGAALLEPAIEDPERKADALYNRGNAGLLSRAYSEAIRDYEEVLRNRPGDRAAKRNLEIALRQQQQEKEKSERQQDRSDEGGASEGEQERPGDADALLRSVEQQEREELKRMRGARQQRRRVGW